MLIPIYAINKKRLLYNKQLYFNLLQQQTCTHKADIYATQLRIQELDSAYIDVGHNSRNMYTA
jgi:hypothetical protein